MCLLKYVPSKQMNFPIPEVILLTSFPEIQFLFETESKEQAAAVEEKRKEVCTRISVNRKSSFTL